MNIQHIKTNISFDKFWILKATFPFDKLADAQGLAHTYVDIWKALILLFQRPNKKNPFFIDSFAHTFSFSIIIMKLEY